MFSPLMDVRQVGADRWMLLAPLVWQEPGWTITVPAGFVTNFASIPLPFTAIWPRSGAWNPAAVVHDYECRHRFRPCREVHARFRTMLSALGVGWLSRTVLYLGVSQFGPAWDTLEMAEYPYPVGAGAITGTPDGYTRAA